MNIFLKSFEISYVDIHLRGKYDQFNISKYIEWIVHVFKNVCLAAAYVPSDGLYNLSYFAISDFLMREINFGNLPSKQFCDENNNYVNSLLQFAVIIIRAKPDLSFGLLIYKSQFRIVFRHPFSLKNPIFHLVILLDLNVIHLAGNKSIYLYHCLLHISDNLHTSRKLILYYNRKTSS